MEEKKFITWTKEHKTELIIAGISIALVATGIFLGAKKDSIALPFTQTVKGVERSSPRKVAVIPLNTLSTPVTETFEVTRTYTPPKSPFDVTEHIRNLPAGKVHSAEKELEAVAKGIDLLPSQTLVDSYTKYAA